MFGTSYGRVKREATKASKEYISEKYGETFNADKVIAYAPPGDGTPFPSSKGNAKVTDTSKGYSVYVKMKTNENRKRVPETIGDSNSPLKIKQKE